MKGDRTQRINCLHPQRKALNDYIITIELSILQCTHLKVFIEY